MLAIMSALPSMPLILVLRMLRHMILCVSMLVCFLIAFILLLLFIVSFLNLIIMTLEQFNFISSLAYLVNAHITLSHDVCLFVACQSALESDYGDSSIAKYNNNLFGMKIPKSRPHVPFCCSSDKASKDFASYADLYSSVMDYIYWLVYNRVNVKQRTNLDKFKSFLVSKSYCPSDDYVNRITSVFDSYNLFKSKLQNESI